MELLIWLQDAFFAAIAAIGFASISNTPRRAIFFSAIIAAIGHATRYVMINNPVFPIHFIAGTLIGILAVFFAPAAKCPAETYLFPSLLPMIPGVYAYRAIGALLRCAYHSSEAAYDTYFRLFTFNGMTCAFIIGALVVGATIPIFALKKVSFSATR
jgi:uncharacterized membrane protein YjjB (DUF3815 family)